MNLDKEAIKKEIKEYCAKFNYPNMDIKEFFNELPNIYQLLKDKLLLDDTIKYQDFYLIAHDVYTNIAMGAFTLRF